MDTNAFTPVEVVFCVPDPVNVGVLHFFLKIENAQEFCARKGFHVITQVVYVMPGAPQSLNLALAQTAAARVVGDAPLRRGQVGHA